MKVKIMWRKCIFAIFSLLLICSFPSLTFAENTPQLIKWKDLIGKVSIEDPFAKLSLEQKTHVSSVFNYLDRTKRKNQSITAEEKEQYEQSLSTLKKQGMNVEKLLAQREQLRILRKQQAETPVATLNGKSVRLAGYLLPLEYEKNGVSSEFLLVPWVGACIHTPPPPSNQIIYIKLNKPYQVDALFSPVEIEGIMEVEQSTSKLTLVDGTDHIVSSYQIKNGTIQAFKAK